jgi:uncharacterized damage-inducible protein DinB
LESRVSEGAITVNSSEYLRRQFAYDAWANQETLVAMRKAGGDARSLQLMAHILSAERLWLERLRQQPQSLPVWPEHDLARCESEAVELARLWPEYLDSLASDDLPRDISYKNTKGEAWTNTIVDVLTHVTMHSAYHRGQIASHMRETGKTPPYTDFIHAVRQGKLK